MAIILNSPRIINGGTMYGPILLGDGNNYFDNRNGTVIGTISARAGDDTFLGGTGSEAVYGEEGHDKLVGGLGNDRLVGGLGNDRLDGGVGNDKLIGGAGRDYLTGGAGNDSFVFDAMPSALEIDVVRDFSSIDDTFQLKKAVFTGLTSRGKLVADAFRLGSSAADAEDRIIYHKATGTLYYDPDGTGAEGQIKIAVLANKAAVALSDFVVI